MPPPSASGRDAPAITVYFDYVSPFAYIAAAVLPAFASRSGIGLDWQPIDLLALSNFENGLPYSDKKRSYVGVDALRQAEYHGVPIALPDPFPVQSERALRLAAVAVARGVLDRIHRPIFEAAWMNSLNLMDDAVLRELLSDAGLDADEWIDAAASDDAANRVAENTRRADDRGVFGVPSMILNDEIFWGIDSLPLLEWRCRQ